MRSRVDSKSSISILKSLTYGGYSLLIIDRYRSHDWKKFELCCKENNIITPFYVCTHVSWALAV